MTYILELSPEVERALERTARRHGVAPDEYLREVVTREVQREEGGGGFLDLLAAGSPRIAAGTTRPLTSEDISQAIADARP